MRADALSASSFFDNPAAVGTARNLAYMFGDIFKLSPGDEGVGHTGACAAWQTLR